MVASSFEPDYETIMMEDATETKDAPLTEVAKTCGPHDTSCHENQVKDKNW